MTVSNQKKHLCPCETKGTMQKMGSKMTCALFFLLKAFWKNQGHGKGHLNRLPPIDYNRPLGTQFLLFQGWNIPITSPTPWGAGGREHPLISLKKSTMEAQHYSLLRRATCENEVSGVLVFFFLSNLGSGRSEQGQGLPSVTELKPCHYFTLCFLGVPSAQRFTTLSSATIRSRRRERVTQEMGRENS